MAVARWRCPRAGAGTLAAAVALVLLATLASCDKSTEPEAPALRTGANAGLAIELPPVYPPAPRLATVATDFSVIESGRIWFRNVTEDPFWLSAYVTDPLTTNRVRVGRCEMKAYETRTLSLDPAYTTTEHVDERWTLVLQERTATHEVILAFE